MFFKEFPLPKEPEFFDYSVNISDFGAISDNKTDISVSVNNAINHVSENGGGKVIVPKGEYFSKPIDFTAAMCYA